MRTLRNAAVGCRSVSLLFFSLSDYCTLYVTEQLHRIFRSRTDGNGLIRPLIQLNHDVIFILTLPSFHRPCSKNRRQLSLSSVGGGVPESVPKTEKLRIRETGCYMKFENLKNHRYLHDTCQKAYEN